MSHLLWKYYIERDVDRFQALLANVSYASQATPRAQSGVNPAGSFGALNATPSGGLGSSPRPTNKSRKTSGHGGPPSIAKNQSAGLSRAEVNSRDFAGLTVLHRAATENEVAFAIALIQHPSIDLYIQDLESGWTALHRALYFGNITIAREILRKDYENSKSHGSGTAARAAGSLIKIKDREGNTAFDVYNATIATRTLAQRSQVEDSEDDSSGTDDDESEVNTDEEETATAHGIGGDEVFSFGSNKNLTLGFGDEDDRQFPERISLKRPDHLIRRFYREQMERAGEHGDFSTTALSEIPTLTHNIPITIQDVCLAKLSSAILTTDPESNLYMCGYGKGGRLGTGDERTQFQYVCVEGGALAGKKIAAVALGQNHTIAISDEGEIFTWGTNTWGQLGYNLPRPSLKDEEPVNTVPRQIFGGLKNERIVGIAASGIHSVAHTSTSLYTWGKNEGQLGLMDSDSRSLEAQTTPRKVAASQFNSTIKMVSAINRATICLLANHTVRVFTNYGYIIVKFPLQEGFNGRFLKHVTTDYGKEPNHISLVTSGGDTIAAVSSRGDLFTVNVSQKLDSIPTATSTTNPSKIRDALSQPLKVWSLRKGNWDGIKSVSVGEDGAVILCTKAGAVWRRVKRTKLANQNTQGPDSRRKDYKFQRIPGLTKITAVRSNTFGAYAAIRKDCDITKSQVVIENQTLWSDLRELFALRDFGSRLAEPTESEDELSKVSKRDPTANLDPLKRAVLVSFDLEAEVSRHLEHNASPDDNYNVYLATTVSEVQIPIHGFMLGGRSSVMRQALTEFRIHGAYSLPEVFSISPGPDNLAVVTFQGLDFISLVNLAIYIYNDAVVGVWHFGRHSPNMAFRFRQIRTELMKLAQKLKMSKLEEAVRLMVDPEMQLDIDMASAVSDPEYFDDADAFVELDGDEMSIHSALICQRCPFFDGLFNGRAAGQWLAGRRQEKSEPVRIDLQHIEPTTFQFVLRYLYADLGSELFDDVTCNDIDEFCELVMDVMEAANELMLDRLSQICQNVIGRFVTTRNVCQLLNLVAPCSVTTFKDTSLEYLCLQLEAMLENHLLDELDDELLLDLDEVVRENQLACLSHVRDDQFSALLHERNPDLAGDILRERQRKIRDMAFRVSLKDEEKQSLSFRARIGSVDDGLSLSPSTEKARRRSKAQRNAPFSPSIRAKDSSADLMFDMDEDDSLLTQSMSPHGQLSDPIPSRSREAPTTPKESWRTSKGKQLDEISPIPSPGLAFSKSIGESLQETAKLPMASSAIPWGSKTPLASTKLDMKEIMAQATTNSSRASNLSLGLSNQKKDESLAKASTPKMSQKERKRQQQQQQMLYDTQKPDEKTASPWQLPKTGPKTLLKDLVVSEAKASVDSPVKPEKPSSSITPRRTASPAPDTRHAGQQRRPLTTQPSSLGSPSPGPSRNTSYLSATAKTYRADVGKAEPSLQLSLADIIAQEKLEQDIAKEAVAKRSLQEIQEEQAFQEWWDKESRRTQEEEERRNRSTTASLSKSKGKRGKGSEVSKTAAGRVPSGDSRPNPIGSTKGNDGTGRGGGRNRGRGNAKEKDKENELKSERFKENKKGKGAPGRGNTTPKELNT